MSADNGIFILKTKRTFLEVRPGHFENNKPNYVYRVAHAQAIDNLSYYKENQLYNLGAYMESVWGESEVYPLYDKVFLKASELLESAGYVEYGIRMIDMSDFIFFGDH